MRSALARAGLALLLSGCCAGPGPRRMIGPPRPDAGRDAPFFFPFDASAPADAASADARLDAHAEAPLDSASERDASSDDAPADDATAGSDEHAALDGAASDDAALAGDDA